ncbi:hypothetical protein [uncultured Clostridium sp.]|uniref:hypothetical protein n=1 Tax=uncultured Clostridium sp. TaxID=59620 RepID=UPI003216CA84
MYKCENCRVKKDVGDDVYLVETLRNTFLPNCSKGCAEETKRKEIKKLQDKIDGINSKDIVKERW